MKKTKANLTPEELSALEKSLEPKVIRHLEDIYAAKSPTNFTIFAVGRQHEGKELARDCSIELWDKEADHLSLVVESDLLPHWAHDTFLPRDPYPICTLHIRVPRISRREYEYDIENLKVQCSPFWIFCPKWKPARDLVHTWIDFGEYLERCVQDIYFPMTSAFRRTVGATGCSNLFNWYQTSGRPFRFQDVPLELRQQIYEYAMGADIYPQVKDIIGVPSVCMGKGFIPQAPFSQLDGTHSPKEEVQPPNLTLSYLNKEIHIEFMGTLWRSARMSFSEPICLQNVATLRLTLPTFALRRIGLNFRNLEYIQFFGVDVIANRQDDITYLLIPSGVAAARILNNGQIPNLGELDIKFRSTRWSPWLGLGAYGLINERDSLCQRDITETILALALDFIFQIDKVNLEGDVKDITKAEFSRAIKKKKKDPTYEPAWPVKKNDIFDSSRTDAFTWDPTCVCRVPCYPTEVAGLIDQMTLRNLLLVAGDNWGNLEEWNAQALSTIQKHVKDFNFDKKAHQKKARQVP